MQSAVEVKHLFFAYDKEYVLEDISATIKDKEYIAIIGPNGGGKSTFVKLLLGLLTPTKGTIAIYGQSPSKSRELIGYLPQNIHFNLDIPLQAKEVILQGRLNAQKHNFNTTDWQKLYTISQQLHITHLLNKKIGELSGGERQRVLLARALITEPKILILDEPTAAVDFKTQKQIYQILQELKLTKIVVSHDVNILLQGVDRVFYINRKLYIHNHIDIPITPQEEHFCEMEIFEKLGSANGCTH